MGYSFFRFLARLRPRLGFSPLPFLGGDAALLLLGLASGRWGCLVQKGLTSFSLILRIPQER
jgi:hypothetical protein